MTTPTTLASVLQSAGLLAADAATTDHLPGADVSRATTTGRDGNGATEPAPLLIVPGAPAVPCAIGMEQANERARAAGSAGESSARPGKAGRLYRAAIAVGVEPDAVLSLDDSAPDELRAMSDETLRAYALALIASAARTQGRQPAGWVHAAQCEGCGPIWLWSPATVLACPWCVNRLAGRPIPRPGSSPEGPRTGRRGASSI